MFSSDQTQNEVTESDSKLFSCDRTRSDVSQSPFNFQFAYGFCFSRGEVKKMKYHLVFV